jgi:predicted dehydrogenase
MRALVIGQGSIGRRHARILDEMGLAVETASRRAGGTYRDIAAALEGEHPDYVVIATETAAHASALAELAVSGFGGTVLVEKPLFAGPRPVPAHRFRHLRVAYQLRLHPALQWLKSALAGETALTAQLYVGQYLPEWRAGRDYSATYSAEAAKGGGVLRDLSHEIDTALWLFGSWRRLTAAGGRLGDLAIDCEDAALLLARFDRCPAVGIQLNYFDRRARRTILVNTAAHSFAVDLIAGTGERDKEEPLSFAVGPDDCYRAMHAAMISGEGDAEIDRLCDAGEAAEVLSVIDAAEQALGAGRWIDRPDASLSAASA